LKKIKILVATHKKYIFPNIPYYPIEVGSILRKDSFGILRDDIGENISNENKTFCELTALYWAWKNNFFLLSEFCGLVHYRRYFSGSFQFGKFSILSENDIYHHMTTSDIILPKKRYYVIETVETHYKHAHYVEDLYTTRNVIAEKFPTYLGSFDKVMKQRSLYLYNMFVMRRRDYEAYMKWLFDILFETEKRVDISQYDSYQSRLFGFLAERLLNVWVKHKNLKIKEIPIVNIEGENKFRKAIGVLSRKFVK
jgi:hypothetical protein